MSRLLSTLAAAALAAGAAWAEDAAAPAAEKGGAPAEKNAALERVLRGIRADGPVTLPEAAQADLLALVPVRRGDECAEPPKVTPAAVGLKDRGDGATLLVRVATCQASSLFALSPGVLLRVARLLDLDDAAQGLLGAVPLNLGGGKHEDDLAVDLSVAPHGQEVRVFQRRDDGFAFAQAGRFRETAMESECQPGSDEAGAWASYLKTDAQHRLMLLRVDNACSGAPSAASCQLWKAEKGELARVGVCALPPRLDAKSLRAGGWK